MTATRIPCSAAARSSGGSPLIRARTMKLRMEASTSSADNSCTGSPSVVLAIRSERRLRAYFLNIRHPWTIDRHQEAMVMSGEASKISAGEPNADPRASRAPTEDFDSSCVLSCSESEPVVTRRSRQNQKRCVPVDYVSVDRPLYLGLGFFNRAGDFFRGKRRSMRLCTMRSRRTIAFASLMFLPDRSMSAATSSRAGCMGRSSNIEQMCCHGGSRLNY